jgi:hypothetical protein
MGFGKTSNAAPVKRGPMILYGRSIHPGVAVAATRLITAHDLMDLHHSKRHAESDQELKEAFRSPAFRVHALSDLGGNPAGGEDQRTVLEVTFWSAVNDLLESRGSGIVFAVASVISRYLRSAIFSLDPRAQEEFRCLSELGRESLQRCVGAQVSIGTKRWNEEEFSLRAVRWVQAGLTRRLPFADLRSRAS